MNQGTDKQRSHTDEHHNVICVQSVTLLIDSERRCFVCFQNLFSESVLKEMYYLTPSFGQEVKKSFE